MDIELEKLKKLEHALHDAIDILRDWQVEEVKPEQERFIVYLARPKYGDCYLTTCTECMWEVEQKEFNAKTKLFVGTCDEAVKWYEPREKFTEIIKAWEDGKTIQIYETLFKRWVDCAGTLEWYTDCKYRVKPVTSCVDGTAPKACVDCEHSEDGKPHPFENYNCYVCEHSEDGKRKYKPYVTVDEFLQDYQERFPTAVPRPAHTMPLIWLRRKNEEQISFVTDFIEGRVRIEDAEYTMAALLDIWTFLDETPVGMEVKE